MREGQARVLRAMFCQIANAPKKPLNNGMLHKKESLRLLSSIVLAGDFVIGGAFLNPRFLKGCTDGLCRRGLGGELSFALNFSFGCRMVMGCHSAEIIAINFT